jgi:hypothetical protein
MNTLCFEVLPSASSVNGHPRYVSEDYAFDFEMDLGEQEQRLGKQDRTSFVIDTLQLEVGVDTSLCLYIWGYCPMGKWGLSSLSPPTARRGLLRAIHDKPLVSAVSIGLEHMMPVNAWFDPESGWFCMGNREVPSGAQAVEFATGCLAVVVDGRLSSLWVRPENWKEVADRLSGGRRKK